MKVHYKPSFIRRLKRLDPKLQEEVIEKIELFKTDPEHPQLKPHKLKGKFRGCYSFSVNYKIRILFEYVSENEVVLLVVGSHAVYHA
ncbi:MAG: proteic killer suppression protein [Candidatus Azotimanducaceae bacterium]|jgi:proteic killer suppression protein